MANWSNPTLTSLYTDFVTEVKNRDVDLALGLDPATTSPTNVPTGSIRWNSASFKYQKWDGSTWNDLSTKYIFTSVEVSGSTVPVNGMYLSTTNTLNFSTASTASRLTIDGSGNVNIDSGTFYVDAVNNRVGVGTTSPSQALHVVQASAQALFEGSTQGNITIQKTGTLGVSLYSDAAGKLTFYDNAGGVNRLILDASGNLGLGVTPSAWSVGKAIEVGNSGNAIWASNQIDLFMTMNAVFTGGSFKYASTNPASRYEQYNGQHQWFTAPSGTAGAAITFTQAMTLDASGRLGIGATSPVATLHSRTDNAGSGSTPLLIQNSSVSANTAVGISFAPNTSDTADRSAVIYGVNSSGGTGNATDLAFHTNANGGSPTEKARIDSSGRLLVGTTSAKTAARPFLGTATPVTPVSQVEGYQIYTDEASRCFMLRGNSTSDIYPYFALVRSKGNALGSNTAVANGDNIGAISFQGMDGTNPVEAASIVATVDAVRGGLDMPGRLVFSTTASTATTPTERMRINSLGYMQGTVNGLGAGRIPAKQYYRLNSSYTGTDGTAAQAIYGVGVTLISSTVYEFEAIYALARNSGTTSHTMSFLFGGTATVNNIFYTGVGPGYSTSIPPLTTFYNYAASFVSTSASAAVASPSMTLSGAIFYIVKGTVSINSGGTFIPQYQLSAAPGGAYSTYAGAYFSIWPLAASGSAVNIGSWA